jgi:hypothetical protein
LLGNGSINKFPRRQILGKQSAARLHKILTTEEVFSLWSSTCLVLGNRTVNVSTIIEGVSMRGPCRRFIGNNKGRLRAIVAEKP